MAKYNKGEVWVRRAPCGVLTQGKEYVLELDNDECLFIRNDYGKLNRFEPDNFTRKTTTPMHTKEQILALVNDETKAGLKALYPYYFEKEYFEFLLGNELNYRSSSEPFYIGKGFAPAHLYHKCLVVHPDYTIEVSEHEGKTILAFVKK